MQQPLLRGLPHEAGISPNTLTALLNAWKEKNLEIHSMMLLRHGKVVCEGWWKPYCAEYPHMLNSLSKSFTSIAVGFAVQEGLLTTEDHVLSFFPDLDVMPDENMRKMQVKHLLTMSTGHQPNADFIFSFADPVRAFLNSEVPLAPGSKFAYNTAATYMLSVIVGRKTGQTLFEYLTPRLFEPLGMMEGISWDVCPLGNSIGGYGLNVKTEDLCKVGLFLLNGGSWNGRQLLDRSWVEQATARHISNDESSQTPWLDTPDNAPEPADFIANDWNRGYGYQFWRCNAKNVYRGDGAFGQYMIVAPDQDMTLAITSGTDELQAVLDEVWRLLLPAVHDEPLPYDEAAQQLLNRTLDTLSLPLVDGAPSAGNAAAFSQKTYQLMHNEFGIERIRTEFGGEDRFTVTVNGKDYTLCSAADRWVENKLDFAQKDVWPFRIQFFPDTACCGAWDAPDEYRIKLTATRMAYTATAALQFTAGRIKLTLSQNVGDDRTVTIWGSML